MGGAAGHFAGIGAFEGGIAGLIGGKALSSGLNKLFSNPAISNYYVNYLNNPSKSVFDTNLGNALMKYLTSTVTPGAVSLAGGQ